MDTRELEEVGYRSWIWLKVLTEATAMKVSWIICVLRERVRNKKIGSLPFWCAAHLGNLHKRLNLSRSCWWFFSLTMSNLCVGGKKHSQIITLTAKCSVKTKEKQSQTKRLKLLLIKQEEDHKVVVKKGKPNRFSIGIQSNKVNIGESIKRWWSRLEINTVSIFPKITKFGGNGDFSCHFKNA